MNTNLKKYFWSSYIFIIMWFWGVSSGSLGIAPSLSLNIEPQSITTWFYISNILELNQCRYLHCIWRLGRQQSLNGSRSLYYAAPKQKTFVLTCSGEDGEVTASVNLNVSDMKILGVPERISLYSED